MSSMNEKIKALYMEMAARFAEKSEFESYKLESA